MEVIRLLAWEFALKSSLCSLPLSLKELAEIAQKHDWDLLSYRQGEQLIQQLNAQQYASTLDAFTLIHRDIRLIFYKDELPYLDKVFAIAHEMGHIALGHTYQGIMGIAKDPQQTNAQEKEANLFGCEILAPSCVLKKCGVHSPTELKEMGILCEQALALYDHIPRKHSLCSHPIRAQLLQQFQPYIREVCKGKRLKKISIQNGKHLFRLLSAALICSLVLTLLTTFHNYNPLSQLTYGVQITPFPHMVYVTVNGEKYHKYGCMYLKGKQNCTALSVADAQENGYTPCAACFPEENLQDDPAPSENN